MIHTRNVMTMKKLLIFLLIVGIAVAAIVGWNYYQRIFKDNVAVEGQEVSLYIPTGADFQAVMDTLEANEILKDSQSFRWLAEFKNYPNHVHPGRYLIKDGTGNNALINMLRSGKQAPVSVTFNNIRKRGELAAVVSKQIEADSASIVAAMNNPDIAESYGFTTETIKAMILPNTYEFYWNTGAKEFLDRMHREYKRFWTDARRQKAEEMGFEPWEVITLASLVEAEQKQHPEEWQVIAGIYINRLEKGMPLQSCPTLIYATGNFKIRRVLDKYKDYKSDYNTYKHTGLPPAPINFPDLGAIQSVLNYKDTDYLYMAAKADFSGYHHFSKTYRQHNLHARKYQRKLNEKGILE